jgi:hypothetical protein
MDLRAGGTGTGVIVPATVNEALARLSTWEHAVRNQANRVLSAPSERHFDTSFKADGYLLVLALRNVLRAANLVRTLAPEPARPGISAAIAVFESRVAGAKDARDVLDHFDEYMRGRGNLQKASGQAMYVEWQEYDGSTFRFCFGVSSGRPVLTLDVLEAQLAAFELRGATEAAIVERLALAGE